MHLYDEIAELLGVSRTEVGDEVFKHLVGQYGNPMPREEAYKRRYKEYVNEILPEMILSIKFKDTFRDPLVIEGYESHHRRFMDGTYMDIPPEVYVEMFKRGIIVDNEMFLHVSQTDESKIAYTENRQALASDTQQRTRIGRFVTSLTGSDKHAPYISSAFTKAMNNYEFGIARSKSEIEDVYMNGPHSCMAQTFSHEWHPSHVYASPDFGVAYIKRRTSKRYSARAVVCFPSMGYTRFYGDSIIEDYLEAEGFEEDPNAYADARLLCIKSYDEIVGPYLDGDLSTADIVGDYLVISGDDSGEYSLSSTSGRALHRTPCSCCGEHTSGEMHTDINGREVCGICVDEYYNYCYFSNELVHMDSMVNVFLPSGIQVLANADLDDFVEDENGNLIVAEYAIYNEETETYAYPE